MSLQVWLPLDGTLQNLGLDDVTPVLMGAGITYTNGKIGKAATFPNSCSSCIHFPGYKYINNFSWTCWFKCIGQGSGAYQFILSEGRDVGSCGLNLRLNKAGTTMFISFMSTSNSGYTARICNINLNTWYHVAITISKDLQLKVYLNGEQIYTIKIGALDYAQSNDRFVIGKMAYNYTSTTAYFPFNGLMNDVRIYDHCLSPKEVKEISKGLVAHYPLNDMIGNENLFRETNLGSLHWSWSGKGGSRTAVSDGEGVILTTTGAANSGSWTCIYFSDSNIKNRIEANTAYTAQVDVWTNVVMTNFSFSVRDGDSLNVLLANDHGIAIPANTWTHVIWHGTSVNDLPISSQCGYLSGTPATTVVGNIVKLKNFKLEKGSVATPWIPNPTDTLYSELGLDDNIVYDCSGYGHNGVNANTTIDGDAPRYSVSMKFDGTNYITLTNSSFPIVLSNDFTLSMWVHSNDDGDRSLWFGNYSISGGGNFFGFEKTTDNKVRFWWNAGNPDKYFNATSVTKSDGWVLLTLVKEGNVAKIYRNGILSESNTNDNYSTVSLPTTASTFRLGADGRITGSTLYKGSISDVRIYATALSAEDIKELYETSASIDNHGNMWAYEIQEV